MNSRYRVTALAFLSLSAGTLWVNPTRADSTAPFKVDPRLLGLPALEEPAPSLPSKAESAPAPQPAAAPTPPSTSQPLPVAQPAQPTPLPPAAALEKPAEPKPLPAAPAPRAAEKPAPVAPIAAPKAPQAPAPAATPSAPPAATVSAQPPSLPPADIDGMPLRLQPTLSLAPHPAQAEEKTPVFISAQQLHGKADTYVEAEQDVELRKLGLRVNADTLRYDETQETVDAKGNVRVQSDVGVIKGPDLHYKLPDSTGFMNTPVYALSGTPSGVPGQGTADKLTFVDEKHFQLDNGKYSTCAVGNEDWWVHANQLAIDRSTDSGVGHNAWIEFKGVPLLYTPYINFSLNNKRESGFLTPTFATSNTRGIEFTVPYYWNIAPNYDATITPRVLSKRGVQLGGEFRYLQPNYAGELQGEVLPNDNVSKSTRSAFRVIHTQNFGAGFSGSVDFEKASDDNYYRDLSTLIAATSKTVLPRNFNLNYGNGPFSAGLSVQRYQILQDPLAPIGEPYERLPQLTAGYRKLDVFGLADVVANAEYVQFGHSTNVQGSRFTLYPSFSVPLTRAYGYITPKFGVHYTQYRLDQNPSTTQYADTTRTLPIFSLDSGLTFEREASLFGQALTQTLEPRVYYLYVPFKNQNQIPLFDSGEPDFSFAQIFSENRFSGGDRISDANQVTLALTSRFIESGTGLERLRLSVAQRYFISTPKVTITPTTAPPSNQASDFLASIGGQFSPAWSADATLQYNPNVGRNEKYNVGTRYNPEPGKLLNFNYRFTRDTLNQFNASGELHQVDASGQWPIALHWNLLGRWNYSIKDKKTVESLGGFEYQSGCWAVRMVAHHFQTAAQQTTNALFLELELSGLAGLGSDPLKVLKQNIGGYSQTKLRPEAINLDEF